MSSEIAYASIAALFLNAPVAYPDRVAGQDCDRPSVARGSGGPRAADDSASRGSLAGTTVERIALATIHAGSLLLMVTGIAALFVRAGG